jgi:hypothetical protein
MDKDTQEAIDMVKNGQVKEQPKGLDKKSLRESIKKTSEPKESEKEPEKEPENSCEGVPVPSKKRKIKAKGKEKEIVLGKNKKVHIKPWTGKTKKKFRKLFENVASIEDVDFVAVINTLLYDYINEKDDIYLNEGEQQYLLAELKRVSIDDKIHGDFECPECMAENTIKTTLDKCMVYSENKLPVKYNSNITLVDIKDRKVFDTAVEEFQNDDEYDGITTEADIEKAMHIKVKNMNIFEVIDYLDELPLKESGDLFIALEDSLPKTIFTHRKVCSNCSKEVDFEIDITQGIFEVLAR